VRVRLDHVPKEPLRLRSAAGERTLTAGSVIEFAAPSSPGLIQIVEGERTLFELGVNFLDESESDLRARGAGDSGAYRPQDGRQQAERSQSADPLFWVLVVILVAALMANWCVPGVERRLA
jgi:hypothetical protein